MMINRTEVLAISGVKGVGELDFFPASELAYSALLTTVTMKLDIHQFGALYYIRYVIIYSVDSQLNIQSLYHVVLVIQYGNHRNVLCLLYWQKHVLHRWIQSQHSMLVAKHHRFYLSTGSYCYQ